ncbi:MAG: restriction endonuclease subunit S [Bacteroidia bacterium]|nr:restriction endonuclease subunit S [Bacteroidia bacterium]
MAHNMVPRLRFPEFDGKWDKEKVVNVFSIFNGYAFSSSDSVDDGCLWVKIADVGIQKMKTDNLSYLPKSFTVKHSKFLLKENDYVVALTRPIISGELKVARINEFFNNSLLNQRVGKLISNENLDYIYFLLQNKRLIKSIENNIAGSDPPNLSPNEINNIKVGLPKKDGQTKIATFLSAIDKRINLIQEKKAELEQYKKGVMQKIFSQTIRFKDENGIDFPNWEEKKMGQLYSFKTTNSYSRDKLNYENGDVRNIHYGDIHTKFKSHFDIKKESVPYLNSDIDTSKIANECFVQQGDLVIADASEDYEDIGKSIEIINLNNEKLVAGLHTFLARRKNPNIAIGFGGHLMKSFYIRLAIKRIAQGTKVLSISTTRLSEIKVQLPSFSEQQKIANFLSTIDISIEKMGNQIDDSVLFKQGLLQKMFV